MVLLAINAVRSNCNSSLLFYQNSIKRYYSFYFHKRSQAAGETVSEYSAELRRLAARCKFPEASLEDTIRDRFVCGLLSEPTQRVDREDPDTKDSYRDGGSYRVG